VIDRDKEGENAKSEGEEQRSPGERFAVGLGRLGLAGHG
jgi:hypothetical protein